MEYLIGLALSLVLFVFSSRVGFDRDRAYYPVVLIVIAFYYVLFAVMDTSRQALGLELAAAAVFILLAVLGFKRSLWFAAAGIVGHGLFDSVHHLFIHNPGVPSFWPGFCMSIDVGIGLIFAFQLWSNRARP